MRRRAGPVDPAHEPPARLIAYDEADWLPLVDPDDYDPERYRNRGPDGPYGEPRFTFENWLRQEAWNLWTRARHDWCQQYGWPGGLTIVDLFRQEVQLVRSRGRSRSAARDSNPHSPNERLLTCHDY